MPEQEYDYRGMIVTYWDLLRSDSSKWSSRPYFLEIIRESGEPALDVACGTGRLLLDYMQEYEIIQDGIVVHSKNYVSSAYLTWYTVGEALDLARDAGFSDVQAHADFKFVPAAEYETNYIVLGKRESA